MREHLRSRLRARAVAFVQHLQGVAAKIGADLPIGHRAARDLRQFSSAEYDLIARRLRRREEIADADAERRENLPQSRDRRADLVRLDHRDRAIRNIRPLRQLALRQAGREPKRPQSVAQILVGLEAVHAFII